MKVWEIWKAADDTQSGCFLVTGCPDETYRLLTHTTEDVPMEFVASFAEPHTVRAFRYSKVILGLVD